MAFAVIGSCTLPSGLAGTIEFSGGPLSALAALNPSLNFDVLVISGPLELPAPSSTTLRANQLTISSSGSIGYSYTPCQYDSAPDIAIHARGQVTINGPINLRGRAGTRTTDSATCDSPWGCDGGHVSIVANNLTIAATIETSGGSGSTMVSSYGSSGCGGGDAGPIRLEATNQLALTAAALYSHFGNGGTGYSSGDPNYGPNGASAEAALISHNHLLMTGSTVENSGAVTLRASQCSIWGPITGSALDASVGGQPDTQGPQLNILAPPPNAVLTLGQPVEVRIQAADLGTGVREIQINGLGYSQTHSATGMVNGVLTVSIAQPVAPATLQVRALDNMGNSTTATVPGLAFSGNVNVAQGDTLEVVGDVTFGPDVSITVAGTMVVKGRTNHKITAGSLRVTSTGIIKDEDTSPEDKYSKAPSLEIVVRGMATIDGVIDFSGNEGWKYYPGENGGDVTIRAAGISAAGSMKSDGAYSLESDGGNGGMITLASSLSLHVAGLLSSKGSSSYDYGGNGGSITLSYLTAANLAGSTMNVAGGSGWDRNGHAGTVATAYIGGPNPATLLSLNEIEPNNSATRPQAILTPVQVNGFVVPADIGDLSVSGDDYEDAFLLQLSKPLAVTVELVPTVPEVDLDLIVAKSSDYSILGSSMHAPLTGWIERIEKLELVAGNYLVLVSQYGETPVTGSAYTLNVRPSLGVDSDSDGVSDWWEKANFGVLDRSGAADTDSDGLTDRQEHDVGTHPSVADTDGDGINDGTEVAQGSNPLAVETNDLRFMAGSCGPSGFVFGIRGPSGQSIVIQRSTDLETWYDWKTNTCTGAYQEVSDGETAATGTRFYRARGL